MLLKTKTALAFIASALSSAIMASDLIDVKFIKSANNTIETTLTFDDEAPAVSGFMQKNSTEINITMPGALNKTGERIINAPNIGLDRAILASDGDKTRLVLDLSAPSSYEMLTQGNEVTLFVIADETTPTAALSALGTITQPTGTPLGQVESFDMRRGEQGEANLLIGLTDSNVNIDVDTQGSDVVVTIPSFKVPESLMAKRNVVDFGTPASFVDFTQLGNDAQIRIETNGEFDMSAYQTDEQLVVSLLPLSPAEITRRAAQASYVGERLSFNFQDIPIKSMLQLIAQVTDLNLVVGSDVQGNIALRLVDVPWDQALDLVLKTKGLDKRIVDNVLYVAPAAQIAQQEALELENDIKMEGLAPLFSEHFEINYADANEINALFAAMNEDVNSGLLSDRGSAVVDTRTNSIIMNDTAARLDAFRDLLSKLDVPVRQVSIEARIVIAGTNFSKDLGVRWGYDYADTNDAGNTVVGSGSIDGVLGRTNGTDINYGDGPGGLVVDLGASPSAGQATSFAIGLLTDDNNFLTLELSALEAEGMGEVISQPKVIAGNQQTAVIQSGSEVPYQEATSSGATAVQFKEATLKLEVTPQITPDNRVIMKLVVNKDSIGEIVGGVPTIDVTQLETQVIANNGETVVLGGIFEQTVVESVAKTPILGDIPYLGSLFKTTSRENDKQETLIFITPRILESPTL